MKLKKKYIHLNSNQRLYNLNIPLVGLSGGIASGKSTVAEILKKEKIQVICADKLVKSLYQKKKTISFLKKIVPPSVKNGKVDFEVLRKEVFNKEELRIKLENFIHPQLSSPFKSSIKKHPRKEVCVYDVPLLFEKNLQKMIDLSICVYSHQVQLEKRLTRRDGIDAKLARKMLTTQFSMKKKRKEADFVIDNTGTFKELEDNTLQLIEEIFEKK